MHLTSLPSRAVGLNYKLRKKEELTLTSEKNRVLGRVGARQLTSEEVRMVCGASGTETETLCSFNPITNAVDGDIHECQA